MFAFAIPPKACTRPGPETTRHTPGLKAKQFVLLKIGQMQYLIHTTYSETW